MTSVFSQSIYKDGTDIIYDCSVEDNEVCFTYGISHGKTNADVVNISEEISTLRIDFPVLRSIMEEESINNDFLVIEDNDDYEFFSNKSDERILIPKKFFNEAYKILKNIWIDD